MKRRFSALVFNFIFVTLIVSQPILGQSDVIVPLNVGNYWVFTDSTFLNDSLIVVDTSRVEITGKTIIEFQGNNYEVFFWNWFDMNSNPPQPEPQKWLIRNEPDGVWEYGMLNDADTLLLQNLALKFPANIGDSWPIISYTINDTSISVRDTLMMACINTDQEFITQIGFFQCYVYQYEWVFLKSSEVNFFYSFKLTQPLYNRQHTEADTLRVKSFFAPDVGLVGQEVNLGFIKTKSYLISYEIVSDVQTFENDLTDFQLYQNYSNPFNPSTTIKYQIPELSYITLKVYDVLGNEIATLVDEEKTAGDYAVRFDSKGLSSGVYFYKLTCKNYSESKKMLLLR
jgi:hypothetical protein